MMRMLNMWMLLPLTWMLNRGESSSVRSLMTRLSTLNSCQWEGIVTNAKRVRELHISQPYFKRQRAYP